MALMQMGFRQKKAEAVISFLDDMEDADASTVLRQALAFFEWDASTRKRS